VARLQSIVKRADGFTTRRRIKGASTILGARHESDIIWSTVLGGGSKDSGYEIQ